MRLLSTAWVLMSLFTPQVAVTQAQDSTVVETKTRPSSPEAAPVPFGVGEQLKYNVHFGPLKVGQGTMEVVGIEDVRGLEAWHTRLRVKGGIPLARVDDLFESWFDVNTLSSLRHVQDISEVKYDRERHYEIYPDRKVYAEDDKPEQPTVPEPLDDGSFLYFLRTVPLEVGQTYTLERYFKPDRNPVTLKVLRKETIKAPAGTFNTIVVQPVIKTKGIFSEGGHAEVWLTDDDQRIMVQMKTKVSFGTLSLYLTSHRPATTESR